MAKIINKNLCSVVAVTPLKNAALWDVATYMHPPLPTFSLLSSGTTGTFGK